MYVVIISLKVSIDNEIHVSLDGRVIHIKAFIKSITEYLKKQTQLFDSQLNQLYDQKLKWSEQERWNLETGKKFNDLVSHYPISEDELLEMSRELCEFVLQTRITDVHEYFFVDNSFDKPRLPFMLNLKSKEYCGGSDNFIVGKLIKGR